MYPRLVTAAIAIVGSTLVGDSSAHRSPALPQEAAQAVFSARSELVVLHVMVKNKSGSYVTGLPSEAFTVLEDGQQQTIQFFGLQDEPVTVGLLIDGSGSMLPVRDHVIAAVGAFAESSNQDDEIFALTFNENVQAVLPANAPFTGDARTLRTALSDAFVARGRTGLHDAIEAGLEYAGKGHRQGKVLVVVSDGGDNASTATFDEVLRLTQISNTVVYTIALTDPLERDARPKRLRKIAEASGGEAFRPRSVAQVEDVLRHIARDIRNTYTIGYVPTNSVRDSRLRRIRVLVNTPNRRDLRVRARQGYLPEEP